MDQVSEIGENVAAVLNRNMLRFCSVYCCWMNVSISLATRIVLSDIESTENFVSL